MAIYNFSRRGRVKGAHLSNWHKATGNLSSITRLTDELNRHAWLLAHRVDKSDYNISSQQVPERLLGIEIVLKGLKAEMSDIFTKEQERLGSEEEAETDLDKDEVQKARALLSKLDEQEKRIKGKRFWAALREGKVFFVFQPKATLENSIGFELDFSRTKSKGPLHFVSNKQRDNFIHGS